jgi:hypothetical protein
VVVGVCDVIGSFALVVEWPVVVYRTIGFRVLFSWLLKCNSHCDGMTRAIDFSSLLFPPPSTASHPPSAMSNAMERVHIPLELLTCPTVTSSSCTTRSYLENQPCHQGEEAQNERSVCVIVSRWKDKKRSG